MVIELKRDANPKVVLNKLYKHTSMQSTFGVNMVALVDNVPKVLPLKDVLVHYVRHQREVIVRRSKHELRDLERRVHRLEGLLIAQDNIDEVIALIRASRDRDTARTGLIERFELTYIQAQAILELRLQQLTALEADALRKEHADLTERIRELRELLGNEDMVLDLIKTELQEISDRYGDERRTEIHPSEDDVDIEDLIADQQMVISITHGGYIKSLPLATYRAQRRGGIGVIGMDMKDEDFIEHLFVSSTHDYLLFFTNRGKVYRSKVYDLPEMGRTSRALSGQRAAAARGRARPVGAGHARLLGGPVPDLRHPQRHGEEDGVPGLQHADPGGRHHRHQHPRGRRAGGRPARRRGRRDPDGLPQGLAVRFKEQDARAMGRDTSGVRGMDVAGKSNYVLTMDVARPGQDLLVVTENGYGKRTSVDEYRLTSRGAKGVKTIAFTEAKGMLSGALVVREHQDLVFISQNGMVQRTAVRGINRYGRTSQGVRVMNLREGDVVSAVALVAESETSTPRRSRTSSTATAPGRPARPIWWTRPRPARTARRRARSKRQNLDGRPVVLRLGVRYSSEHQRKGVVRS